MENMTIFELIVIILAALTTVLAGILVTYISYYTNKNKNSKEKEITEILKAIRKKSDERKLKSIKKMYKDDSNSDFIAVDENDTSVYDEELKILEGFIDNYHIQGLNQASVQFWFSIGASVLGFLMIIYKVFMTKDTSNLSIIQTLPGIVVEIVSVLFFKQARETRKRATELYDRLRRDNQKAKSIEIVDSITHEELKSSVKAKIALHMSGIKISSDEICRIIKPHEVNEEGNND